MQVVPTQPGVPLATAHTVLQEPQWLMLLVSEASHPSPGSASQLPQPVLQTIEHLLAEQLGVPLTALQAAPQSPQ